MDGGDISPGLHRDVFDIAKRTEGVPNGIVRTLKGEQLNQNSGHFGPRPNNGAGNIPELDRIKTLIMLLKAFVHKGDTHYCPRANLNGLHTEFVTETGGYRLSDVSMPHPRRKGRGVKYNSPLVTRWHYDSGHRNKKKRKGEKNSPKKARRPRPRTG